MGLNSTSCHLIESVALLTKPMGIVTLLVLTRGGVVALRLLSYRSTLLAHIMPRKIDQIVSYMGFGVRKEGKRKRGSPMYLRSKVKSKRNKGLDILHSPGCGVPGGDWAYPK